MRFRKPMVAEAVDAYAAIAERRGLTLVQLALGYVQQPLVRRRDDHRRDDRWRSSRRTSRRRSSTSTRRLADVAAVQLRYPNPAGY